MVYLASFEKKNVKALKKKKKDIKKSPLDVFLRSSILAFTSALESFPLDL